LTSSKLIHVIFGYLIYCLEKHLNHTMICRQKQMMERVQIYCAVDRKRVQVAMLSL